MKYLRFFFSPIILPISCLLFLSCSKNITSQYLGGNEIHSKSKENLVTVMFEEKIFQKYKNNIEVFEGVNETNDNLKIKHLIPQMSKILLDPGDYTFFISSKRKYIQYLENEEKTVSKPYTYKIFFTGEPGKVYLFAQRGKGVEESFEFQSITN